MKGIGNFLRFFGAVFLLLGISISSISAFITLEDLQTTTPTVEINIEPYSTIYEGDIIDCIISGDPTIKYWTIKVNILLSIMTVL